MTVDIPYFDGLFIEQVLSKYQGPRDRVLGAPSTFGASAVPNKSAVRLGISM